eukprot:m.64910 g.64910  ORF g.64910 m.64910 type:complete len:231 (-) comp12033_c1_seq4:203-895(-)
MTRRQGKKTRWSAKKPIGAGANAKPKSVKPKKSSTSSTAATSSTASPSLAAKYNAPVTPFRARVYALLQRVPLGKVTTYKVLADALSCGSAQAIGQAMRHNPRPARRYSVTDNMDYLDEPEVCAAFTAIQRDAYMCIVIAVSSLLLLPLPAFTVVLIAVAHHAVAQMVPCHRVIKTDLTIGGFAGKTDIASADICDKVSLLKGEGVEMIEANGTLKLLSQPHMAKSVHLQ